MALHTERAIGHAQARKAVDAMAEAALARGQAVVLAVVDHHGLMKAFLRLDGANLVSTTVAEHKAVTAALLTIPSGQVGRDELANFGDPRITYWAGGVPILLDGACVGGIGVSGLTNEEDEELARIGLSAITAG